MPGAPQQGISTPGGSLAALVPSLGRVLCMVGLAPEDRCGLGADFVGVRPPALLARDAAYSAGVGVEELPAVEALTVEPGEHGELADRVGPVSGRSTYGVAARVVSER